MFPQSYIFYRLSFNLYSALFLVAFVYVIISVTFEYKRINESIYTHIIVSIAVIISSFAGARLLSVLNYIMKGGNYNLMEFSFWKWAIASRGQIAYGGVISGVLTAAIVLFLLKKNVWRLLDLYAIKMGLGVFLMRIGCFCSGCCYGHGNIDICRLNFKPFTSAGTYQRSFTLEGLFPSQLLAAIFGLLIFFFLNFLKTKNIQKGNLTLLFLILYGTSRFITDFTRFYEQSEVFLYLTYTQWISVFVVIISVLFIKKIKGPLYEQNIIN